MACTEAAVGAVTAGSGVRTATARGWADGSAAIAASSVDGSTPGWLGCMAAASVTGATGDT